MLARIRKAIDEREGGFTLIELLVVMIIIGILAAIAIPMFMNQKKKATETSAKSDATSIYQEVAAFMVDSTPNSVTPGALDATKTRYPITASWGGSPADEVTTVKITKGNTLGIVQVPAAPAAATDFCVTVTPGTYVAGDASTPQPWSVDGNGGQSGTTCP